MNTTGLSRRVTGHLLPPVTAAATVMCWGWADPGVLTTVLLILTAVALMVTGPARHGTRAGAA